MTLPDLTPRESQIAELIAEGLNNEQIANRLVLSPGTVANHVRNILGKLGARSRVEVAVRFVQDKTSSQSQTVLELLDRLRQVRRATLSGALQHATDVLAAVFAADKVDAFILNPTESMLVANGTSRTPMGRRQHELGLNRIALANGGRVAWVFREQRPYLDGHVEADEMELQRARVDLGVRSAMMVPFEVDANARGVLAVVSGQPERFTEEQLHLLQFVSYWVGLVAQELNR